MSRLEFLIVDALSDSERFTPVARSPIEHSARAAGARFELRDGWNVAVGYTSPEQEAECCRRTAGWADVSHLGKLELQGAPDDLRAIAADAGAGDGLELGRITQAAGASWYPITHQRVLVVCQPVQLPGLRGRLQEGAASARGPVSLLDVSCAFAAMMIVGPLARELFARFCAIDLRPQITPMGSVRPGSIARQPGILARTGEEAFLFLFGWAVAEYIWTVVEDAGRHLGGAPVGLDALAALGVLVEEVPSGA